MICRARWYGADAFAGDHRRNRRHSRQPARHQQEGIISSRAAMRNGNAASIDNVNVSRAVRDFAKRRIDA